MFTVIFSIINNIISLFKVKSDAETARLNFASALVSTHNWLINIGLGLIVFTCGFAFFHDLFYMPLFSPEARPMITHDMWKLIGAFFAAGALHVANRNK